MHTAVGIFRDWASAANGVQALLEKGISNDRIACLTGQQAETRIADLPTSDTEPEGMGKTLGGYVGGVTGASAGLGLGSAVASLMVPGIGPILAAGIGAAALLGVGGAAVGAELGHKSEDATDLGTPKDDTFVYRELLGRGRSLVIVSAGSESEASDARRILLDEGSEDFSAARDQWREAQSSGRLPYAS